MTLIMDGRTVQRRRYDKGAELAANAREAHKDMLVYSAIERDKIKQCKSAIKQADKIIKGAQQKLKDAGTSAQQKAEARALIERMRKTRHDFEEQLEKYTKKRKHVHEEMGVLKDIANANNPIKRMRSKKEEGFLLGGVGGFGPALRPGHRKWSFIKY